MWRLKCEKEKLTNSEIHGKYEWGLWKQGVIFSEVTVSLSYLVFSHETAMTLYLSLVCTFNTTPILWCVGN